MKIRKLNARDVTFTVTVEPEYELPVEGNYSISEDDSINKKAESEIIDRCERGDELAWCSIIVKATWKGIDATAILGAMSLPEDSTTADVEAEAKLQGVYDDALDALNQELERVAGLLSELEMSETERPRTFAKSVYCGYLLTCDDDENAYISGPECFTKLYCQKGWHLLGGSLVLLERTPDTAAWVTPELLDALQERAEEIT